MDSGKSFRKSWRIEFLFIRLSSSDLSVDELPNKNANLKLSWSVEDKLSLFVDDILENSNQAFMYYLDSFMTYYDYW